MEYMFLLYSDPARFAALPAEERSVSMNKHWSVIDDATVRGVFKGCSPLEPAEKTLTIRAENGRAAVTDGPFIETREMLGGYYILECQDAEEAKAWGLRLLGGCGAAVEVRALRPMPVRVDSPSAEPALAHA